MASEYTPVALAIIGVAFLWYSNELTKRNSFLWAQAFQIISFLFILANFGVMNQLYRADTYYDLEDLITVSLFSMIFWVMWIIMLLWILSIFISFLSGLGNPKRKNIKKLGGNEYGP